MHRNRSIPAVSVIPVLVYPDVRAAVAFLEDAFGFTERVQIGEDRVVPPAHADWMARHVPHPELWLRPRDGHVSVLRACPVAIDWLRAR